MSPTSHNIDQTLDRLPFANLQASHLAGDSVKTVTKLLFQLPQLCLLPLKVTHQPTLQPRQLTLTLFK
jgi:hypothetical protein